MLLPTRFKQFFSEKFLSPPSPSSSSPKSFSFNFPASLRSNSRAAFSASPPKMATEPPSLPSYPEMIMKALEALNEPTGSNKSSIAKHIEATYGELPASNLTLLSHHLNRMKESGELVFAKNNYMKPDPNAPPKRGRGRPPKAKAPLPPDTVLSPPRPRGRPPKDPNTPPKPKTSTGSGRPRGRPKKVARTLPESGAVVSRGRGRPPKEKPAALTEVSVEQ